MKRLIAILVVCLVILSLTIRTTLKKDIISNVSKTLRKNYSGGNNLKIAIIDSGIAKEQAANVTCIDYTEEGCEDYIDHGTPIYDIIANNKYGMTQNVSIYSLKVINKYSVASTQAIVCALEWCLENSIDIINMSLSFGAYNESIECLIQELVSSGVIIVASINNVSKKLDYPAMYNGVICVGKTDNPNQYSKENSIIFDDDYVVQAVGIQGYSKDYVGNSFLTPIVTGIIACLINKTLEERGRISEELVEQAKCVLEESNVNIE